MVLQNKGPSITQRRKIALYVPFLGFGIKHHTKDQGGLAEAFVKLKYETHLIVGGVKGNFNPPGYHVIETGNIDKGKTIRGSLREFFNVLPIFLRTDYNYIMIWNYNRLLPLIVILLRIYYFLRKGLWDISSPIHSQASGCEAAPCRILMSQSCLSSSGISFALLISCPRKNQLPNCFF